MRIELLLLLIKHYANNPANYFLPPYIKSELHEARNYHLPGRKYNYYIVNSRASETACGVTAQGLLAVLSNLSNGLNIIFPNQDGISTQDEFNKLRSAISTGCNIFLDQSNTVDFLIYQFTIEGYAYQRHEGGGHNSHSINHKFFIIQYMDKERDLRYCMLQSYAGNQSLLQFINSSEFNNTLVMTHDDMHHFLHRLQHFINAKVIDDNIADFYQKYFKIPIVSKSFNLCRQVTPILGQNGIPQDIQINQSPLALNVQWARSNLSTVCKNLHKHITEAQQLDAPQIIEIPENCDNHILQPFGALMNTSEQQNLPNPIFLLYVDLFSGQLISKTIDKSQLPILEAFQPKKMTDIKYPASKNGTLTEFKRLIDETDNVSELQEIFDIACVCVNQHQNARWDSFWDIQNTSSLREIMTIIRDKALDLLFKDAPPENNINERIHHFENASKMSLFNKHKNNFKLTGAFGRTHALKVIENEIDRLRAIPIAASYKL